MLQTLLYGLFGISSVIHLVALSISAIPSILSAIIWVKNKFWDCFILYIIVTLVFIYNFIFYPENRMHLDAYILQLYLMCLPAYTNMSLVRNIDFLRKCLLYTCYIVMAFGFLYFLGVLSKRIYLNSNSYNMAFSYYMLLPSSGFTYFFLKDKNLKYILLILLSIVPMILLGSRHSIKYFV